MQIQKRIFLVFSFSAIVIAIAFQLLQLSKLDIEKAELPLINRMPKFEFTNLQDQPFTNIDLPHNQPIVFMYLDPSCDECDQMVKKIIKHFDEFEKVNLIMVSEADKSLILSFSEKYALETYDNINVLIDHQELMYKEFNLIEYPSFVVYDANLNHLQTVDQYVTLSIVVKYVRKALKKTR